MTARGRRLLGMRRVEGVSIASWRILAQLGRCAVCALGKERQSGKVTETGGRDKTAASRGCLGGRRVQQISDLAPEPLPATQAHPAGSSDAFTSSISSLRASNPDLPAGAAS